MAHSERDAANSRRPSSFSTGGSISGRNDKPLFAPRDRRGKYFTGTGVPKDESEETEPTTAAQARRTDGRNWLSRGKSSTKLGFGEAFMRLDENGALKPKTAQNAEGRDSARPESRIPRRASYTPGETPSPPRSLGRAYRMAEAEERSASVPIENQRLRPDTSPSPAARSRTLGRRSTDERRMQRLRNSDPVDLKGQKSNPLGRQKDTVEAEENESAAVSSASGSSLSALSLVEDPTEDDFDQKMKKFSVEQQRVTEMARSRRGPFSRADIGPKVAETARSLVRKTSVSSLSNENEPPLQPPRTWGSKAKKLQGWINKAMSPDSSVEIKGLPPAPHRERASTEKQETDADVPLPSIEDASIQEPTPPSSRPASAQPNSMSPEKSKLWAAELDFTAQSITMSPQLRVRNTKIDDIRSREIQNVAKSAIASGRLEEIRERNSEERSASPENVRKASRERMPQSPASGRERGNEESMLHERTILEEEGEPIRGTPITIFSSSSYVTRSSSNSSDRRSDHDREGGRSTQKRDDSRDVLRRLARATSGSPSPFRSEEGRTQTQTQTPKERMEEKEKGKGKDGSERNVEVKDGEAVEENKDEKTPKVPQQREFTRRPERTRDDPIKRLSHGSDLDRKRLSASDVDPEERIAAEASLFELQDNKSERNSLRAPSPGAPSPAPSNNGDVDATPKPKPDPLSQPTPKVTGAYIDTPAPMTRPSSRLHEVSAPPGTDEATELEIENMIKDERNTSRERSRSRSAKDRSRSSSNPPRRQVTKPKERPPLLNTANPSTASEDLRRIQQEAQIDDSTLDDFDAILEADARVMGDLNDTTISEAVIDLEYDERGRPLSQKEKELRLERLALERMSKSLKKTSASIHDAKLGIEGLIKTQESSSNTQVHDHTTCPTCAAQSAHYHITIPIPRLTTRAPPSHRRRLTWFGLFLAVFLTWYISESVMCEYFCHPKYATSNNISWSPWDPFFPYAIPSKLDHWTGRVASGAAFKVYDVWTDGKGERPRWAGPDPRWLGREKTAFPHDQERKRSGVWQWAGFGDWSKQDEGSQSASRNQLGAGESGVKQKQRSHEQPRSATWNWPRFLAQDKRQAKDPDPDPWDEPGDVGSMFEDETI